MPSFVEVRGQERISKRDDSEDASSELRALKARGTRLSRLETTHSPLWCGTTKSIVIKSDIKNQDNALV